MKKIVISYTFNILVHLFRIFMANYLSICKMFMCTLLEGEGSRRKYVLYTHLNVNNYERALKIALFRIYDNLNPIFCISVLSLCLPIES